MRYLTTPSERFEHLPGYWFEPHFVEVDPSGMRMHFVDEGPRDAPVVLLLHGEPSWSYLYRFMIPELARAGLRVVAPDLIGFGKSDKPAEKAAYSYASHMQWVTRFIEALDLEGITLFGQDWGALLGLRLAAEQEARFAAVMIGNGYLPTGELPAIRRGRWLSVLAFLAWRAFALYSPVLPVSRVLSAGTARELTPAELRAYDAPFPGPEYKAGARTFPALVPLTPLDPARSANLAAWKVLEAWHKPFVTAFSKGDPITRGLDRVLQRRIPGARGQDHSRVEGGHFLQEDAGVALAQRLAALAHSVTAA